jgi:NAD(P)H-nitrite reductase large subunit
MSQSKIIICRCEEVTLETVVETLDQYHCSSRELKLRTRAGMGICGGRTCRPFLEEIVVKRTGQSSNNNSLVYQPPVRPILFPVQKRNEEQ